MIPNTLPRSLAANPRLDSWIGFEADRTVRLRVGKVEIGQGILTALTQIAAEELDVSPERIRILSGETGRTPDEIYTSGSLSIEVSGGSLRLVCAEVRALFLERAAEILGAPRADLSIEDGAFHRQGEATGLGYWELAGAVDLAREAIAAAPTKRPAEYRIVGRSLPRLDLPARIAHPAFIHDLAPPHMLHARMIRQPWRDARLASIDEDRIRRAGPDVQLIRVGDVLAVVSADEAVAIAAAAAAHAAAAWEGGRPAPAQVDQPGWLMAEPTRDRVIDSGAPPPAAVVRTVTALYSRPYIAHASIAPSCALAQRDGDHLTLFTHSQGVYPLRNAIARALRLEPDRISVLHRPGAGCYGHNGADDAAFDAALLAMHLPGRPVRVQWSREDELAAAPVGAAMAVRISAGLDRAGRPVAWTTEIWSGPHGQRPGMNGAVNLLGAAALPDQPPAPEPADVPDANGGGGTRNAVALYDFPQRVIHHFIPHLPVRTSSLRTLGAFANVFAIECFMDELAGQAGEDPVAWRLSLLSDPRARRVIETAAAMAGWPDDAAPGEGRAKGFAFSRYKNRAAYLACVAEVEAEEEVRVKRVWCAVDAGLVINPDGARNQIEGGIIQAASWTLKEQVRFRDGRIASTTWDDYPILRFSEVPEVAIALADAPAEPPLGLGEVAHGPVAAAIGNAVARALGVRLRNLPLTRERIVEALLAASGPAEAEARRPE